MKKIFTFLFLLSVLSTYAQSNKSNYISINIQKEVKPAILSLVSNSLTFVDANGNNAIDANEDCKFRFAIKNDGFGDGYNCIAKISHDGHADGITYNNVTLPIIKAGQTISVEIPIKSAINTINGKVNFKIFVQEPNGFNTQTHELAIETREYIKPEFKVIECIASSGSGDNHLSKMSPFDLQLLMQNVKQGIAEDVVVNVKVPEKVFVLSGTDKLQSRYASIQAGETKSLDFKLVVNQEYSQDLIPIKVSLKEKYGKYAKDTVVTLKLNQSLASNRIEIKAQEQSYKEIQIASLISTVDKNIPVTNKKNEKTFAVIIANENYKSVASVPFALNDGNIFREYCSKTLGIPEKNIRLVPDASGNEIKAQVSWLQQICKVYTDAQIIFYYAGHGIPDESSRTSYLLPVDGYGTDVSTGYKLDDLYTALGELPAKNVTVFMDACFSGSKREQGMLASARGVAIKAKGSDPRGKMVVFSAAQGDETAYPNHDEKHGMFTYYLLKKMQDTKGDVTLQELGDYITTQVSQQSIVINGKSQTPCVTPSKSLGESWKNWTLK